MKVVNFGGNDYPWKLSILALETFCELSEIEFSDYAARVSKPNTKDVKNLLWAGMIGGAAVDKKPLDLKLEDFITEANNYSLGELIELIPKEKNVEAP